MQVDQMSCGRPSDILARKRSVAYEKKISNLRLHNILAYIIGDGGETLKGKALVNHQVVILPLGHLEEK